VSRGRERRRDPDAPAGPWLDPAEAEPKLVVFARPGPDGGVPADVEAALATGAVAALVVDPRELPEEARAPALDGCRAACRRHATALLLRGDAAAARDAAADGVHLDDAGRVAAARGLLGADGLVGVSCGLSRHAAMVAGDAGADYVVFGSLDQEPETDGDVADLVAWWSDLFVVPCAAAGRLTPELALSLAHAGADLLAVRHGGSELRHGLVALAGALALARQQPKIGQT
jgi:thiamine-phosphate pyrophosphorylase